MNPLWVVLFSCKTFFSRRRCHIRELYVPSLWATSPVGQCLAGGICSSVGRWVAAPSETHPQRCGTSCSWLEQVNFNGRSYASKPILKSCLPCPAFVCSLLLFSLRLVLGQEDGPGGEGSLGRQQAAGDGGTPGQEQHFGCYRESWAHLCVLLTGALWLQDCAGLGGEERLWKGQVVSRAAVLPQGFYLHCSCLDFLPRE